MREPFASEIAVLPVLPQLHAGEAERITWAASSAIEARAALAWKRSMA